MTRDPSNVPPQDSESADESDIHWRTRLIHSAAQPPTGFRSLTTPTYRASTTVFDTLADAYQSWRPGGPYTYGIYGTPTTLKLAARIAEIEKARHTFIVPSGQSAIALIYLVYCRTGSHALMPESAYGNSREIADDLLAGFDIEVESYDPMIGAGIAELIRPNTHRSFGPKAPARSRWKCKTSPRSSPPPAPTKSPSRSTTPTPPASCSTLLRTASTSACRPSPNTSAATATSSSAPSPS